MPDKDSNPNKQSQSLSCYHYTIGQYIPIFTANVIIPVFVVFVNAFIAVFLAFLTPLIPTVFFLPTCKAFH